MIRAVDIAWPGRLQPMSLEIGRGELVCLVGPNGSGKTSLLHALAGIGGASGRVEIGGAELALLQSARRPRTLAFLPASRDVHWPLTVRDVVALSDASEAEVAAALTALEMEPLAARRIDRLSTGERSRALIARAFAPDPLLLLLDEPTANLDPLWQLKLIELVRERVRSGRRSAVVAMHDLDAAATCADRLLVMDRGGFAADGEPREVMAGPAIGAVFGIEKAAGRWRPLSRPADPRSSR